MAGFDPMILSRWFEFRILNHRFHSLRRLEEAGTGALPSTICLEWMGAAIIGKFTGFSHVWSLCLLWFSFCLRSFGLSRVHGA
jgi:hypothetical protein